MEGGPLKEYKLPVKKDKASFTLKEYGLSLKGEMKVKVNIFGERKEANLKSHTVHFSVSIVELNFSFSSFIFEHSE